MKLLGLRCVLVKEVYMKILEFLTGALICSTIIPFCAEVEAQNTASPGAQRAFSPERRQRLLQFMDRRRAANGGNMTEGRGAQIAIDAENVKFQQDVAYGPDARQKLDIYSPAKQAGPLPLILFVHGGGWQRGNKSMHREKGKSYAENGVIFVATNYRLAPDVMHPKQIQDIASAFAWVKQHAAELGVDESRIYIMGHSAGAQLVDLLGTNDRFLAEKGLSLKDIKGVISLDTASLNLAERMNEGTNEASLVGGMITNAFGKDARVLADASPTACIHAGQTYPPFLMFCGEKRKSCVAQHERFSAAMSNAKGLAVVKAVPLSHGEISRTAGQPDAAIFKAVLDFVKS